MKSNVMVLLALLVLTSFHSWARTITIDGVQWTYGRKSERDRFWTLGANDYNDVNAPVNPKAIPASTTGNITTPRSINGVTVGAISGSAFQNCTHITGIEISLGIREIQASTFKGCTSLERVVIPNTVTNIYNGYAESNPFAGCSKISSVTIPGQFEISRLFSNSTITNVVFTPGCTKISYRLPSSVVSVTIDSGSVRDIDASLVADEIHITDLKKWCGVRFNSGHAQGELYLNGELIETLMIPEGTPEIKNKVFSGFSQFKSVTIPGSVTNIGDNAFSSCIGISNILLSSGLQAIGNAAFTKCSKIETLIFPSSLVRIGSNAFSSCSSLKSIDFSNSRTDIGTYSFRYCDSLTSVNFGTNIVALSDYSFSNCPRLRELRIPGSVQAVGRNAFLDCANLATAEIGNGVRSIEYDAFSGCSNLVSVSLPDSIQWIRHRAFKNCSTLSNVMLPTNLWTLGNNAFSGCSSLSFLLLPERIREVINPIASDCPSLKALVMPMSYISENTSWQVALERMGVSEEYEFYTERPLSAAVESQGEPVVMYVRKERQWGPVSDSAASDGFVLKSEPVETNSVAEVRTTVVGPGTFSFDWKISAGRGDYARVYLDDVLEQSITRSSDWASLTFELTEGEHTFTWLFQRGGGEATGEEAAFLDNVGWFPRYTLEVVSEEGIPSPQLGTTSYVYGAVVNAVVKTPDPVGGVRHVCTGWTGKGSVPASGTGTNVTFTIEANSRITWNWKTQNQIALVVEGGVCSFGTQWIDDGATVSANIVPSPHLYSISLSGDTNGVSLSGTTITIPSDRPRTITATVTETKLSFDVTSQFGTTSPSTGRTEWSWNETIAASATPDEPVDGTRRVCTGWTGTGSVPSSGTESMVSFAIQDNSSIVWNWRTEHFVSFQTDTSVSAEFSEAWKTDGETIVVDYTLLVSYAELELAGDVDGVTLNQSARTVTIPVNRPRNVILRATKILSLPEALDAANLPWTTDEGFEWIAQTTVSADGEDAAKSAGVSGSQASGLETTVRGPGTLRWKYKLEAAGVSGLDVILDGNAGSPVRSYEESCNWTADALEFVDDVTHTIRFEFWNAGSSANDCAYLDMVSWNGGTSWLEVTGVTSIYDGTTKSVSAEASFLGGATAAFRYALAEDGPYSETNPSFTDAGTNTVWVVASAAGEYPITNSAQVIILPKALDASMFESVQDQVFDGAAKTPLIVPTANWCGILDVEDYAAQYENNIEVGVASIIVTGARNCSGQITIPFTILESADTVWFVDAENGSDENSGRSWADALRTIQSAVGRAVAGNTVLVTNGVYESFTTDGLGITIRSVEGPENTIVDGGGVSRCAFLGFNTNDVEMTTLVGFTLRNGRNMHGTGAFGGVVENCVITGNYAGKDNDPSFEGCGGGLFKSIARNCVISNNMAQAHGGGVDLCEVSHCIIVDNQARGNGAGARRSSVSDSLIARNVSLNDRGSASGGGARNCRLIRCTVAGNLAGPGGSSSPGQGGIDSCQSVENCIIYENKLTDGTDSNANGSTITYSCLGSSVSGTGNIVADPLFVDSANGNYRLAANSPCIDAGAAGDLDLSFDLDGNPRVKGRSIDMGCYEFQTVQTETTTTPVPVPFAWLDEYPEALAANGDDYETFGNATAANGADKVWQCYVSGVNPTNATERFLAQIAVTNGTADVWWTPDLNEGGTKSERVYKIEGKTNLVDQSWGPTNESTRFFRVKVEMP